MTDEERERRERRILEIFADWGAPEEWRAFIRAHGASPTEATKLLAEMEEVLDARRWRKALIKGVKETSAVIAAMGTVIVLGYGALRFFGIAP